MGIFDNPYNSSSSNSSSAQTAQQSGGYSSATQGYSAAGKKGATFYGVSSKKKKKPTSKEIDKVIESNIPQVNQKIEQVSKSAKDYNMIKSYSPQSQFISRTILPKETMTTQDANRSRFNPARSSQEFMSLKQEQDIAETKFIESKYGTNAPKKEIARYYGLQTGLFVTGVGEGALTGINPLLIVKGTYDIISKPVSSFNQLRSSYRYNPAGFFGNLAGQTATTSLLGAGVSSASRTITS